MSAPHRPGKQPEMPALLRRPACPGARPCQGRSSLDRACAPAEYGSYREARTGKISQFEVSTLSGEPRLVVVAAFGAVVAGVEGGAEVGGGGVETAAYVDLVVAGAGVVGGEGVAGRVADVGQGYAGAEGVAPGAGGDLAYGEAVAED